MILMSMFCYTASKSLRSIWWSAVMERQQQMSLWLQILFPRSSLHQCLLLQTPSEWSELHRHWQRQSVVQGFIYTSLKTDQIYSYISTRIYSYVKYTNILLCITLPCIYRTPSRILHCILQNFLCIWNYNI